MFETSDDPRYYFAAAFGAMVQWYVAEPDSDEGAGKLENSLMYVFLRRFGAPPITNGQFPYPMQSQQTVDPSSG